MTQSVGSGAPGTPRSANQVSFAEATKILRAASRDRCFCLVGDTGIGKSAIAEMLLEPGEQLYTFIGSSMAPEDWSGIPSPVKGDDGEPKYSRMLPLQVLAQCCAPDGPPATIFIDEAAGASVEVQKAIRNMLWTRQPPNSGLTLRLNVRVLLATNEPEHGGYDLPLPLSVRAGRLVFLRVVPDLAEWLAWHAATFPDYPEVRDFLALGENHRYFCPPLNQFGGQNAKFDGIPRARSWTVVTLNQIDHLRGGGTTRDRGFEVLVHGCVGAMPEAAADFYRSCVVRVAMPAPSLVCDPTTVSTALHALQRRDADGNLLRVRGTNGNTVPAFDAPLATSYGNTVAAYLAREPVTDAMWLAVFQFVSALAGGLPEVAAAIKAALRAQCGQKLAASEYGHLFASAPVGGR